VQTVVSSKPFHLPGIILLDEIFYATYGELWFFYIFLTESETRLTDPDYARGYNVMFSDGYPFLITSQVLFFILFCSLQMKNYLQMLLKQKTLPNNASLFSGFTGCAKWETRRACTN
jgi:hypothetical protein